MCVRCRGSAVATIHTGRCICYARYSGVGISGGRECKHMFVRRSRVIIFDSGLTVPCKNIRRSLSHSVFSKGTANGERERDAPNLRFSRSRRRPRTLAPRPADVRVALVSDLIEGVDLVLVREQGACNAVHGALPQRYDRRRRRQYEHCECRRGIGAGKYLEVEAAGAVDVLEELRARVVASGVQADNLLPEVAPNDVNPSNMMDENLAARSRLQACKSLLA